MQGDEEVTRESVHVQADFLSSLPPSCHLLYPHANLDRPEPPFANLLSLPAFQLSFSTVFITRLTSMKLIKHTY